MKRLGLHLLPATLLVSACSSLHTVDSADRNAWLAEAHSSLAGGEASVILRHGETYSGTVVALAGDGTSGALRSSEGRSAVRQPGLTTTSS